MISSHLVQFFSYQLRIHCDIFDEPNACFVGATTHGTSATNFGLDGAGLVTV